MQMYVYAPSGLRTKTNVKNSIKAQNALSMMSFERSRNTSTNELVPRHVPKWDPASAHLHLSIGGWMLLCRELPWP